MASLWSLLFSEASLFCTAFTPGQAIVEHFAKQTKEAMEKEVSNCPYCAIGHDNNAKRIYRLNEMDADHVTAWSHGGATDASNCQMLCRSHNRAKGNR